MSRQHRHPDIAVERLLQELEREGVDPAVIDSFAFQAVIRRNRGEAVSSDRPLEAEGAPDLQA